LNVASAVLLVFGLASSLVLVGVGLQRAVTRRYRDRTGVAREGRAAVQAGLLVAVIGAGELAITIVLWTTLR
jgi:hypothetical protein